MNTKLSTLSRLNLLARHEHGEHVTLLCKEFNISRTLFYRLAKRSRRTHFRLHAFIPQDQTMSSVKKDTDVMRQLQSEILKMADGKGKTVSEVCRMHGISRTLFYRWRKEHEVNDLSATSSYLKKTLPTAVKSSFSGSSMRNKSRVTNLYLDT